jgi:hypothetical protein
MVFDAHARAFAFLGGVPRRGIYDNLKPAVDAIFVGRERRYNRRFLVMCNHYLVEPTACTPAAGWEKGQVENQVGNVREWVFTPKLRFADLAQLNAHLSARCWQLASERAHPDAPERKVIEVWDEERASLRAMPAPFDGYAERSCRISNSSKSSFIAPTIAAAALPLLLSFDRQTLGDLVGTLPQPLRGCQGRWHRRGCGWLFDGR